MYLDHKYSACNFHGVMHELGHGLGLVHPMERNDVDDFINTDWHKLYHVTRKYHVRKELTLDLLLNYCKQGSAGMRIWYR